MNRNHILGTVALGFLALLSFNSAAYAATIYGGTTTVTLNTATIGALTGLGFSITPVAPSTLGGTPLAATFPITGGDTSMDITHSGGLAFAKGGTTADIENFVINLSGPNANTITGQVLVNGSLVGTAGLFDIGSGLALTLDSALAGDLVSVFGVPNLTGASIGTASVNASTTPEPTSIALGGLGLLAAALVARRRVRTN
jgi:uncharacterized protein (TIGR03382 family)